MRKTYVAIATGTALTSAAALAGPTIEFGEGKSITVGAGVRAGYSAIEQGAPNGSDDSNAFDIQSVRLYMNGTVSDKVKFTFNTECEGCVFGQDAGDPVGAHGDIGVLDAIAQFELSDELNIWIGRMLTPADRIEMNGPYYGLNWNQYTVPLLPSDQLGRAGLLGRDDGVTLWGSTGKLQYAFGLFDGVDGGPNQADNLLYAGRIAYNFLNKEANPGYYTSSTYYGSGGDIFTLGLSFQSQADGAGTAAEPTDFDALILDALFEKPIAGGGVVTIEGEYKTFDADLTASALADPSCFCLFSGDAYFVTLAYLFPRTSGVRFQPYVRFTKNQPDFAGVADSELVELGMNYLIDGHNLKLNLNYTSGDANLTGFPGARDADGFSFGMQAQL